MSGCDDTVESHFRRRCAAPAGNEAQTAAISSLTASGMFSTAYLRQAIDAVGVDRILF